MKGLVFLSWASVAFAAALLYEFIRFKVGFECVRCGAVSQYRNQRLIDVWRLKRDGCPDCNQPNPEDKE